MHLSKPLSTTTNHMSCADGLSVISLVLYSLPYILFIKISRELYTSYLHMNETAATSCTCTGSKNIIYIIYNKALPRVIVLMVI